MYGTSDQGEPARKVHHAPRDEDDFETREETPRPRSRLEQVIDNAVNIAEDVIASSNPNLAKLWHTEYNKEMKRENQGSRSTTPYFTGTPRIDEGLYI